MAGDGVKGQIDSLILDIQVKDGSGQESSAKRISALDKALSHFQTTIKSLDITGFKSKFASMTSALKPFVNKIKEAQSALRTLDAAAKKTGAQVGGGSVKIGTKEVEVGEGAKGTTPKALKGKAPQLKAYHGDAKFYSSQQIKNVSDLTAKYGKLRKQITDTSGVTTLFFEDYEKDNRITKKFTAILGKNGKILNNSLRDLGSTVDDLSGDSLKAFFLSLKRIAMYRAIRTSLSIIVKMFKEGIINVAKFDNITKHAMDEIHSSFIVIKNSIGLVFKPLIDLVAPFVRTLAKQLGEVANVIATITANLLGQKEVWLVNTEYFEEMNKQMHLLEFDKFSVLSNMDSTGNMFLPKSLEAVNEQYKGILITIQAISALLLSIGAIKLVTWLIGGGLTKVVNLIKNIPSGLSKVYKNLSPIAIAVAGILEAIEAWHDIMNWDETTTGLQKVMNVLTVILGVVAAIAGILAAFLPTGGAKIAKAVAFTAALGGLVTTAIGKTQKHADGGLFEGTGTMYHLAGESGAEIVAQGSRGTGVVNTSQFTAAMVQALAEYGVARQNSTGTPVVIELDGKEIARSQVRNNANELMRNYNLVLKPR